MKHREEFRAYMKAANRTSDNNDEAHLSEAQVIAYCRNEMPAAEREAAEAHLVYCEQCIALFRNAHDFLDPARDDEQEITAAETDDAWRSLWPQVQPEASTSVVSGDFQRGREKKISSFVPLALAASLLISLGALGWQTWRYLNERQSRRQSEEIATRLETRERELEQRLKELEQNGNNELQQEREQRRAAEAARDDLLARLSEQGREDIVPVFRATLSSERGSADDVRVRFTSATKSARLRLLINKPYEFPVYTIEIADHNGRVVSKSSELRPTGDDGALSLLVNRSAFSTGGYKLRLFSGTEKKQLGEFGMSVTVDR
ncbi:MAG TPA: hypothetical protein VLB46_16730 [Pyrinomonadaceae bacterium]|nr:hypothetical protein [Pyrinomonadaceae bacterium]